MAKRKGPSIETRYYCHDCEYHQVQEGHCGRANLCAAPSVIEQYGEPQYTCTTDGQAPQFICPYRI
jgi:hypothetical protein